ncbi:MAG: hypothetical protein GXP31_18870 [Kiritimatiellaeota bacterium]|nr:hypothetical protein [Kiritimatiellota bacterium]
MPVARTFVVALACTMLPAALPAAAAASPALFAEDFEAMGRAENLPKGWTWFSKSGGLRPDSAHAHSGRFALRIEDNSAKDAAGLRSPHLVIEPNARYRVDWWYFGERGMSASLYLEFWNSGRKRIEARSFGSPGTGAWEQRRATAVAPPEAVTLTVLFYSASTNRTVGWFDDIAVRKGRSQQWRVRKLRPPAVVRYPCGLYRAADIARAKENLKRHAWARNVLDDLRRRAAFWVDLPPDELSFWIPDLTPFRVVDCPKCGAGWRFAWHASPNKLVCRKCGFVWPDPKLTEDRVQDFPDPVGGTQRIPYYEGKPSNSYGSARSGIYRLSGHLRYVRLSRLASLGASGMVYALTGEKRYAEAVRRTLLRLAEVYPHYLPHDWRRVYADYNRLQAGKLSGWKYSDELTFMQLAAAYDLTVNSGLYTDGDRSRIEEGCFREFARLMVAVSPRGTCINDGITAMASAILVGRLLGNPEVVRWAVEPPDGFLSFLDKYFRRDGHWYEASPSYELMSILQLPAIPEALRGWRVPDDIAPRLGRLTDDPLIRKVPVALARCVMPDGSLPPTNDSVRQARYPRRLAETAAFWRPTPENRALLAWAWGDDFGRTGDVYALFRRDPVLGRGSVVPRSPSDGSRVEPGIGWAILRTESAEGDAALFLDYGPQGGGHGHDDRLNIIWYDFGRELVTDLGYLGWGHPNLPWMHSAAAHNHVIVDGKSPGPAAGTLGALCGEGPILAVDAAAPRVYEGVTDVYRRRVILLDHGPGRRLLLDCFEVRGGTDHQYAFHAGGDRFTPPSLGFESIAAKKLGKPETGYRWMRELRSARTGDAPFACTWTDRRKDLPGLHLVLLPEPESRLVCATAPGLRNRHTPFAERDLHVVLLRHPGPASRFLSVAQAFRGNTPPPIVRRLKTRSEKGDVAALEVRFSAGVNESAVVVFASDAAARAGVRVLGAPEPLMVRARSAVVEWNAAGRLTRLWLQGGTSVRSGSAELQCTPPVTGTIEAVRTSPATFDVDVPLPLGERLAGDYLVIGEVDDGAYRIASVEMPTGGRGARVRLAEDPIVRARAGQRFRVVPWALAEFRDNGVCELRGSARGLRVAARTAGALYRRAGKGPWTKIEPAVRAGASLGVSFDAVRTRSAQIVVTPAPIERDRAPPRAIAVLGPDGKSLPGSEPGYLRSPHRLDLLVREDRVLDVERIRARLEGGGRTLSISVAAARAPEVGPDMWRLVCRLPTRLKPADYNLRVTVGDRAFHTTEIPVRFTTRGIVLSFREFDVTASSGRLVKWIGSLDTRFYRARKPGDWVEFGFDVPRSGTWNVRLVFTMHETYGIAKVSIDGQSVGAPVNLYAPGTRKAAGRVDLGAIRLSPGRHRIRFAVSGKAPESGGYYLGLCELVLQ